MHVERRELFKLELNSKLFLQVKRSVSAQPARHQLSISIGIKDGPGYRLLYRCALSILSPEAPVCKKIPLLLALLHAPDLILLNIYIEMSLYEAANVFSLQGFVSSQQRPKPPQ